MSLDASPNAWPGYQPCFKSSRWPMFAADKGAGGVGAAKDGGDAGAETEGEGSVERSAVGVVAGEWSGCMARRRALLSTYWPREPDGVGAGVLDDSSVRLSMDKAFFGSRSGTDVESAL